MTTRHVATLHVTDSNGGIHDIITIEAEKRPSLVDEVAIVTKHDHNGKREWRYSGPEGLEDAWIAALRMAGYGDFKRDRYDS